jgi:methionyl-tRNA formyltransferase
LELGTWNLELQKLGGVDIAVVAAYAKILPKEILDSLPDKFLGVHPSLLPQYRGATPIQSAILAGEAETGTTLFLLDAKVDHGKIISSRKYKVLSDDNYETLIEKLAVLSGDLLIETLPKFATGAIDLITQDENQATYTKKFKTEDAFVDLQKDDPIVIERKIRALNPEPGVYAIKNSKRVKILDKNTIQVEGKSPQKIDGLHSFFSRTD